MAPSLSAGSWPLFFRRLKWSGRRSARFYISEETTLDQARSFPCHSAGIGTRTDSQFRFQGLLGTATTTGNRSIRWCKSFFTSLAKRSGTYGAIIPIRPLFSGILSVGPFLHIQTPEAADSCTLDGRRSRLWRTDECCPYYSGRTLFKR